METFIAFSTRSLRLDNCDSFRGPDSNERFHSRNAATKTAVKGWSVRCACCAYNSSSDRPDQKFVSNLLALRLSDPNDIDLSMIKTQDQKDARIRSTNTHFTTMSARTNSPTGVNALSISEIADCEPIAPVPGGATSGAASAAGPTGAGEGGRPA